MTLNIFKPLAIGSALLLGACAGTPPADLGLHAGKLKACPSSPNCVSSNATDEKHQIAPLRYEGDTQAAKAKLVTVIQNMPRTNIVTNQDDYLYVEFSSAIMRFVDDVEFHFPGDQTIQVRSASRLGYSDLGANRRRVEKIRNAMQ